MAASHMTDIEIVGFNGSIDTIVGWAESLVVTASGRWYLHRDRHAESRDLKAGATKGEIEHELERGQVTAFATPIKMAEDCSTVIVYDRIAIGSCCEPALAVLQRASPVVLSLDLESRREARACSHTTAMQTLQATAELALEILLQIIATKARSSERRESTEETLVAELAYYSAISPNTKRLVACRQGALMALSGQAEKLRLYFDIAVKPQLPTWSYDGYVSLVKEMIQAALVQHQPAATRTDRVASSAHVLEEELKRFAVELSRGGGDERSARAADIAATYAATGPVWTTEQVRTVVDRYRSAFTVDVSNTRLEDLRVLTSRTAFWFGLTINQKHRVNWRPPYLLRELAETV